MAALCGDSHDQDRRRLRSLSIALPARVYAALGLLCRLARRRGAALCCLPLPSLARSIGGTARSAPKVLRKSADLSTAGPKNLCTTWPPRRGVAPTREYAI